MLRGPLFPLTAAFSAARYNPNPIVPEAAVRAQADGRAILTAFDSPPPVAPSGA